MGWEAYRQHLGTLPATHRLWPLYGAGFDHLGLHRRPITAPLPTPGDDELLVRHDACGLCYSDVKVIRAGQHHPRIYRDPRTSPIILGHEVSLTIAAVGARWRGAYRVGDRFVIQPDIYLDGVGYAYGYEIAGGLAGYAVLDRRIIEGGYLLPLGDPAMAYAEAALAEPWACVLAAYSLHYRTAPRPGGTLWLVGTPSTRTDYTFSAGFDETAHPARLLMSNLPTPLETRFRELATRLNVEVICPATPADAAGGVDDIIILGADAVAVEQHAPHLRRHGVLAVIADTPMPRPVRLDVGRIHYERWLYTGGRGPDITQAYRPVRSALRREGRVWFVGAGGPMGWMHVQHALLIDGGPRLILCTEIDESRLHHLRESFEEQARARGITFHTLNPRRGEDAARLASLRARGFDDVIILVPAPEVIAEAATALAPDGVLNIFAGIPRGRHAPLDMSAIYLRGVRLIGHSGSTIDDMRRVLNLTEAGKLAPHHVVAAIGSLDAAWEGLRAVAEGRYPGKIIIYPHLRTLPLTALPELRHSLPQVHARLRDGRIWTRAAETALFDALYPP